MAKFLMVSVHLVMMREFQMSLKFLHNVNSEIVDPKNFKSDQLCDQKPSSVCVIIPPNSFAFSKTTIEHL